MTIKNLNTGATVEVANTRVTRDGSIVVNYKGKDPSPRYFKKYPMLKIVGHKEDGTAIMALDFGWQVENTKTQPTPAPEETTGDTTGDGSNTVEDGDAGDATETDTTGETTGDESNSGETTGDAGDAGETSETTGDTGDGVDTTGDTTEVTEVTEVTDYDPAKIDEEEQEALDHLGAYMRKMREKIKSDVMNELDNQKPAPQSKRYEFPDCPEGNEVEGVTCDQFDAMLLMLKLGYPVYMWGAAGGGKSHTAAQLADGLGLPLFEQSQVLFAHDVKGYGDAAGHYVRTPFYRAFTEGGLFFLDEMDASQPEALVVLNMAIANRRYEFPVIGNVKAHPNFRVCAAGNTALTGADSQYTGRNVQDASARNRFAFFKMDYDRRIELPVIARGNEEVVNFVEDMRKAVEATGIELVVSYRQTAILSDPILLANIDKSTLLQTAIFGGMEIDEIRMLHSALQDQSCDWAEAMSSLINRL